MGNNPEEPTLTNLINNFNAIKKIKMPRLTILNLQLYAEHYVNEIIDFEVGDNAREEIRTHLSFPQKLRILKKMKILEEKQIKILELLNRIRDEMVHELVVNPDKITAKLKYTKFDFIYGWSAINKNGGKIGKIIDLKKAYKKVNDNFLKFFTSNILIIGILHNRLKIMKKLPVNEFIDLKFIEGNKNTNISLTVRKLNA